MSKGEADKWCDQREAEIIDKLNTVVEELRIMGFDAKSNGKQIECDTIAGKVCISISEKTVMGNVYRVISHVGSKLHKWGLENKKKLSS